MNYLNNLLLSSIGAAGKKVILLLGTNHISDLEGFNPRHVPGSIAACLFPCGLVGTMFQGK